LGHVLEYLSPVMLQNLGIKIQVVKARGATCS